MNVHTAAMSYRRQRGVSTLAITMLLLIILSLVVLFSTSVGFFEQRTATNENRARIAEQAAEAGINLAGEALKANRDKVISNITGGWLDSTTTNAGWKSCAGVTDTATIDGRPHPCRSEANSTRRAQLWFYTTDGTGASIATTRFIDSTSIGNVGGAAAFPSVVDVQAVLCRIDSSLATPACASSPAKGNRIAVTFIATATLTNENTTAVIKETWASYTDASQTSAVPIIGSGFVKGLGNAQIVTNPNAGGYGVPASIWSPNDVGISGPSSGCGLSNSGVGSFSSCQLGEFLKSTPPSELKTTCVTSNNACGCPAITGSGSNFLSGHSASTKKEGIDILDRDGGKGVLPDIGFFPGLDCSGNNLSDTNVSTDDSLFEWIFNAANVVAEGGGSVLTNCGPAFNQNCASYTLISELNAEVITCAQLNTLGASASGLYYIQGTCDLPGQVGSPNAPAIVVMEGEAKVNNTNFFGMLFLRSNNNTAQFKGVGNSKIIGSLVVEGNIDISGSIDIIYDNTAVSTDPNQLPRNAKFARVPGSWLDATEGF